MLGVGDRLGPYEVVSPLGAGGMGEVYRARDPRLGREVALKVLPEGLASDPERLKRFEREAKATAALAHPNVLTVFDVGQEGERTYLVFELLVGSTLAEVMKDGGLRIREALDYATQVARGLAAAHARGIVHRDVKPANLLLTPSGIVKILDFGLARIGPVAVEATEQTTEEVTRPGMALGTVSYMSPEQVKGHAVDGRSDLFSLGVVLYEMVSGRHPFRRPSSAETVSAILRDEPPALGALPGQVSAPIERLLERCLEKRPDDRFQTAGDLALALDLLAQGEGKEARASGNRDADADPKPVVGPPRLPGWSLPTRWLALAAAILALGGVVFMRRKASPPVSESASGFRVALLTKLSGLSGPELDPALSPDARSVAFCAETAPEPGLYVKDIGTSRQVRVADRLGGLFSPAWSPDGREIAFQRHPKSGERLDEIVVVPAAGGAERALGTTRSSNHGLDWSPDGRLLAFVDKVEAKGPDAIHLLTIRTGERRRLTTPVATSSPYVGDYEPSFSPDGQSVAFVRRGGMTPTSTAVYVHDIGSSDSRPIASGFGVRDVAWAPDGRSLVFVAGRGRGALWVVGLAGGKARRVYGPEANVNTLSVARASRTLALEQIVVDDNVWRGSGPASVRNEPPRALFRSPQTDIHPDYSPDGRHIALASNRKDRLGVWICAEDGTDCADVKSEHSLARPQWSPDGKSLAAVGWQGDLPHDIFRLEVEGRFVRQLTTDNAVDTMPSWSRDGRWLYFSSDRSGTFEIWKMPSTGGEPRQLTRHGGIVAYETADGRSICFMNNLGSLWRMPAEGGDETLVLDERIQMARWTLWRDRIVYVSEPAAGAPHLVMFDPRTRRRTPLGSLEKPLAPGLAVSPDGAWILYAQRDQATSEILMLEGLN